MTRLKLPLTLMLLAMLFPSLAQAAVSPLDFTVNTSENVVVDTTNGTPSINLDVGGVTRQAVYQSGSNSNALVFRYTPVAGDVDLDGVALGSAINPNSGLLRDTNGNPMTDFTVSPPSTPNVKINYPSLSMDFVADADGRYTLNGTAYDTLATFLSAASGSFTRSSSGTYFDSSGVLQTASSGTPRFDHDPVTHAIKGILIEESRTNSLIRSATLDTWGSVTSITTTANALTSPDGTTSADLVTRTSTASNWIGQGSSKSASALAYTLSIYAKLNTARYIALRAQGTYPSRADVCFDLQTGTISTAANVSSSFTSPSATITDVGSGWYRLSLTATTDTNTNVTFMVSPRATNGVIDGTDTSTSASAYFWGGQVEQGAFPTSYIPTTTTAVARSADNLSFPTGSWYDATKSTFFGWVYGEKNTNQTFYGRWIGANVGAPMSFSGSLSQVESWTGTNPSFNASFTPAASQTQTVKGALSWDTTNNARSIVANGGTITASSIPGSYSFTTLYIGSSVNSNVLNAPIRQIKYYPLRVADTQLQLLTQ